MFPLGISSIANFAHHAAGEEEYEEEEEYEDKMDVIEYNFIADKSCLLAFQVSLV